MSWRTSTRPWLPFFVCSVLACTPTGGSNDAEDEKGGDAHATASSSGASPSGTGPNRLSCLGVLTCAGECPDDPSGDACVQDCLDRTAPDSEEVTQAFASCLNEKQCQDADCIKRECGDELDACLADDASQESGKPPSEPAPAPTAGSIPADLVGLWAVGSTSYQFDADGSTTQVFSSQAGEYCTYGTAIASSGVTTTDGDTLVYHRVEGTLVTTSCGSTESKSMAPADIVYRYALGTSSNGEPELSLSFVNDDGTLADPLVLHH